MATVAQLEALGFDASTKERTTLRLRCSQCEALVINGQPTHELGCPNAKRECDGCPNLIPARAFSRYCQDCR